MARKQRIEFEGAFYHIITRGNQKQKIFKDKDDFLKYLEILFECKKLYNYLLYSYVLMSNHVHLLIETLEIPLSKILQGVNQRYTMYFNKKYKTVGHVFQGRYKAILCDKDEYLLSLIKYIHLNPVRAKIGRTPNEYQWSSHHCYTKESGKEGIVNTDQVLRMFSENKAKARKLYRAYMGNSLAVKKEDIYCTVDQRILGNEGFLEKVMDKCDIEIMQRKRQKEYPLSEIAKGVEKAYGISLKQIREKGKDRDISTGRKLFSFIAHEYGYKGKEIAEYAKKDPASVTRYLKEKRDFYEGIKKVNKVLKDDR